MSLIAWLPLTNNLNNQGASNMSFTSVNATQNTFGKIGKSYTFGTSSTGARLYSDLFTPKTSSFSMCCWYKAAEGNSTSGYIMGLSKAQNANFMLYKNGTTGFRIYSNSGNTLHTHGIDITKWHHLTLTNDGTTTRLYIDGVSVKTRSTPTDYTLDQYRIFLGCRSNHADTTGAGSGYSNTGYYNDFRFYDHCLSAAEVHEISQGLVQHYKCDDLHNLITDNSPKTVTISSGTSAYTGYWYLDTRAKSDGWLKQGTVYTVMYDYTATLTSTNALFYSQINTTRCVPSKSQTQIVSQTSGTIVEEFTLNADQAAYSASFRFRIRLYSAKVGDTATISNLRIYMGKASEYTKIIDSSGYGHNGTITGTLLPMYNTPRYQWATSGGAGYATTDYVFDSTNLSSEFTWAGWIYRNYTDNSEQKYIYSGTAQIYLHTTFAARIAWNQATVDSSTGNAWDPSQTIPLNEWTYLAFTYKDGILKVYINGEYKKSNDRTASGTYIKGYKANYLFANESAAKKFSGGVSDMRVYCTALSDADIKQLYELGAKIDNKGGLHCYEAKENLSNIIFKADSARAAKVFKDGLSSFTQANCQVTLTDSGYRIYRPPNLNNSNNGGADNMWGGLCLVNQTSDTVAAYDATRDNNWNLIKGHTYLAAFHAKGKSSNSTTWKWDNKMGWGGGGLTPSPTVIVNEGIPSGFNGEKDCIYIFTINDNIAKNCTSAYSTYVSGTTYLSYRHLTFGWGYTNTGELGTDLYLTNFRLYDITSQLSQILKTGVANFYDFVEENGTFKIRCKSEAETSNLIEF